MAQNEMKAKLALPERVRSMEGLGLTRIGKKLLDRGMVFLLGTCRPTWTGAVQDLRGTESSWNGFAAEAGEGTYFSMKEDAFNSNVRTKLFGGSLNVIGDYHEYWNDALVPVQLRRRNQPSDTNHC